MLVGIAPWNSARVMISKRFLFDPFHVNGFLLYPLKISGNHRFSNVFRGYWKKSVTWNGLKWKWIKVYLFWGILSRLKAVNYICKKQKQPPRCVPRKRCSENMQQTYRRTPMPKCDSSKVAKQLYWSRTSAWVFSSKFAAYFQNTFS